MSLFLLSIGQNNRPYKNIFQATHSSQSLFTHFPKGLRHRPPPFHKPRPPPLTQPSPSPLTVPLLRNDKILYFFLFILLIFSPLFPKTRAKSSKYDLVQNSCVHTSYPAFCLRTLSSCGGAATNPRELAQLAVKVTISRVRKASDFLLQLKGRGRREQGALSDCIEQMGDSMEELRKTMSALQHLRRGGDFEWQMSNAETWVSAALANEDTCLDWFKEIDGKVRSDVRRKITNVARVTSSALSLINDLDNSHGKKPSAP